MIQLTIAIPSYNRAALLEQRLLELIPQLRDEVEIFICNDGSTDHTAEVCAKYASDKIRVHENNPNLGMSGSMLTLFLHARGKWMWTLGDDDSALPDAVSTILQTIEKYPESGVITFHNPTITLTRDTEYLTLGDFLAERQPIEVSFLSANLYHLEMIRPHLKAFIQSTFTTAPQSVVILRMLETRTAPVRLLLARVLGETDANRRWSSLDVAVGWSLIPEFIKDPALQKQAAVGMWYSTRWLQKYGLREVHDAGSFQQWKRKCRSSNLILAAYGINLLSLLFRRPFIAKEYRAGVEAAFVGLLPYFAISKTAKKMRDRRGGESVITENT